MTTYQQLRKDAEDYYALCAKAERLGIDTSLDTNPSLSTVDALRAEVERCEQSMLEVL